MMGILEAAASSITLARRETTTATRPINRVWLGPAETSQLVQGAAHYQSSLLRLQPGPAEFLLTSGAENRNDDRAVHVLHNGRTVVGYLSPLYASPIGEILNRLKADGIELWVDGRINDAVNPRRTVTIAGQHLARLKAQIQAWREMPERS